MWGTIKRVFLNIFMERNIVEITWSPARMWMVTSQTGTGTQHRCLMHSLPLSSTLLPPFPVENMHCTKGHCKVLEEGKPCSAETKPPLFDPQHSHRESEPSVCQQLGQREPYARQNQSSGSTMSAPWEILTCLEQRQRRSG